MFFTVVPRRFCKPPEGPNCTPTFFEGDWFAIIKSTSEDGLPRTYEKPRGNFWEAFSFLVFELRPEGDIV